MRTLKSGWDVERAAAWLRRHGWGDSGEETAPPLTEALVAEAEAGQAGSLTEEEIDIACWPALVAPFYD